MPVVPLVLLTTSSAPSGDKEKDCKVRAMPFRPCKVAWKPSRPMLIHLSHLPRGAENAGGGYVVERLPVEATVGVVVGDIRVAAAGAAVAQGAAAQFLDAAAGYA